MGLIGEWKAVDAIQYNKNINMDNELQLLTTMLCSLVEQTANKWQHASLPMPPRHCYVCKDLGHLAHKCPQQCYMCGLTGHKRVHCTTTTTMADHTRNGMEIANKAFLSLPLQSINKSKGRNGIDESAMKVAILSSAIFRSSDGLILT
uniref:CCHC-type domain-containing protein n=1 Tax=Romanomermis culicivorax TaxID=13658 RepID=A0A915I0S3_ROMCU